MIEVSTSWSNFIETYPHAHFIIKYEKILKRKNYVKKIFMYLLYRKKSCLKWWTKFVSGSKIECFVHQETNKIFCSFENFSICPKALFALWLLLSWRREEWIGSVMFNGPWPRPENGGLLCSREHFLVYHPSNITLFVFERVRVDHNSTDFVAVAFTSNIKREVTQKWWMDKTGLDKTTTLVSCKIAQTYSITLANQTKSLVIAYFNYVKFIAMF